MRFSASIKSFFFSHRAHLPIVLAIVCALSGHVWAVLQGTNNFTSDQAAFGFDIWELRRGAWYPYASRLKYWGNIYPFFGLPFLWLFGWGNVIALKIPYLIFTAIFFVLHTIFVQRMWGKQVALWSLILLAIPNYQFYKVSFFLHFNLYAPIVTAYVLLWFALKEKHNVYRSFICKAGCIGLLMGLGLWYNESSKIFVVTILSLMLLSSYEWKRAYDSFYRYVCNMHPRLFSIIWLLAWIVLVGFCISLLHKVPNAFQIYFQPIAYVVTTGICLLLLCHLRPGWIRMMLMPMCAWFGGIVIGYAPKWINILMGAKSGSMTRNWQLPVLQDFVVAIFDILPRLWSVLQTPRSLNWGDFLSIEAYCWMLYFLFFILLLVYFLWKERSTLGTLATFAPLKPDQRKTAYILLICGLFTGALLMQKLKIVAQMRFILMSWPAFTILFAVSLSDIFHRFGKKLQITFLIVFLIVSAMHIRAGERAWDPSRTTFAKQNLIELKYFCDVYGVKGGYGDYWIANALHFLYAGDLEIARYKKNKYSLYSANVQNFRRYAVVTKFVRVPKHSKDPEELTRYLRKRQETKGLEAEPFEYTFTRFEDARYVDRRRIGKWDVWILEDA